MMVLAGRRPELGFELLQCWPSFASDEFLDRLACRGVQVSLKDLLCLALLVRVGILFQSIAVSRARVVLR